MALSHSDVVEHLHRILRPAQVVTDHAELQRSSVDNFRKLQNIFDVHTMRLPAAIVYVESTDDVQRVLALAVEDRKSTRLNSSH